MLLRERSGGAHMTVAEKHSNRSITLYQATIKSLEEKLAKVRVEKEQLQRDLGVKEDELAAALKEKQADEEDAELSPDKTIHDSQGDNVRRRTAGRGAKDKKRRVWRSSCLASTRT